MAQARQRNHKVAKSAKNKFNREVAVAKVRKLHGEIEAHDRNTLKAAIEAGGCLEAIRKDVKREGGHWMKWVKENLKNPSHETVTRYIRVFKTHKAGKLTGVKSLTDAYKMFDKAGKGKRKDSGPKPVSSKLSVANIVEWLHEHKTSAVLKIKAHSFNEFLRVLKQSAAQAGKGVAVVFEPIHDVPVLRSVKPVKAKLSIVRKPVVKRKTA